MTRDDAYRKLLSEYEVMRNNAQVEQQVRENTAREKIPGLAELLVRRIELPLSTLKRAMADPKQARSAAEQMKNEGKALNLSIRRLLANSGYPEDYLDVRYACRKCKDTGFLPEQPGVLCECFSSKLSKLMREMDGITDFDTQSFEKFDVNAIPEDEIAPGLTQRVFTQRVRDLCEDYADSYPNCFKPNMVLSGPAGVGKTFLLNCIAQRVEARGFSVRVVSAYSLLEAMRAHHMHNEEGETEFESLLKEDLLLIDDLGSEPVLRNISKEYLCVLINERGLKNRHTVIACNLNRTQINEMYGERVMSRLCDKQKWDFVELKGKDIRRA